MKKEEMELILSVVAQRSVGLSDNQFKSVEMQDPVDLLDALGFTEVKLVIPTKEAIVVVDCGEKQIVIRGDDEVLRFIDKKMDCPGIVNATGLFCFIRMKQQKVLNFLPLEVVYLMQGKTPEWFAKQYNKYVF